MKEWAIDVGSPEVADPYDLTILLEHCMGDAELGDELLERFQSRLTTIEQSLQACVGEGDLAAAIRIAHSLKGEAGILAAGKLQDLAAQLEQSLQTPDCPDLNDLLNRLRLAVQQCVQATPAARSALKTRT